MGSRWEARGDTMGELFQMELGSLMAHSSGPAYPTQPTHTCGVDYLKTQHTVPWAPPSPPPPHIYMVGATVSSAKSPLIWLQRNWGDSLTVQVLGTLGVFLSEVLLEEDF